MLDNFSVSDTEEEDVLSQITQEADEEDTMIGSLSNQIEEDESQNIDTAQSTSPEGTENGLDLRYFPSKLFQLLEDAEHKDFEDVVSWVLDGAGFKVHDRTKFVKELMPLYFDQTHYQSFRRQLNLYGFTRVSKGGDKGVYFHGLFLRSERDSCHVLIRKSND